VSRAGIDWYVRRLSLMSAGEIVWRVSQAIGDRVERLRPARVSVTVRSAAAHLPGWPVPEGVDVAAHVAQAEAVLAGRVELFGEPVSVGFPDADWNRDPVSGLRLPLSSWKNDYLRSASFVAALRTLWEVNRHYQFVALAQGYALTGERRFREAALALVDSWIESCPYPRGPNWVSALEHGIRLLNWYLGARLLRLAVSEMPRRWLESIYLHCRFIDRNRSRFSSANNHLIGEMAGLYVAANAWPFWPESAKWREEARRVLESEARLQVHEDGVGREQTVGYQIFVLHFLILTGLVGELHDRPFTREYWSIVRSMIGFLRAIADCRGRLPDFGDCDEGMGFMLSPQARARRLQDLLELDDYWSDRAPGCPTGSSAAAWLATAFPRPVNWPREEWPRARAFPQGGYFVLGRDLGSPREVLLVFDAGPLGYLSIAAHGHADCLSFVLSIGGRRVLVDPGTYCYHRDWKWRDYFRSTAAHNTVRVDGENQSEIGGPFMWLHKAAPRLISLSLDSPVQRIRAQHDGYRRLRDGVIHERDVRLDCGNRELEVRDTLQCNGAHVVERFWHLDPECEVRRMDDASSILIETGNLRIELACSDGELRILRGSLEPRAGWISPRFGDLRETTTIVATSVIRGTTRLVTRFRWTVSGQDTSRREEEVVETLSRSVSVV